MTTITIIFKWGIIILFIKNLIKMKINYLNQLILS
jgi:hypothetical protein